MRDWGLLILLGEIMSFRESSQGDFLGNVMHSATGLLKSFTGVILMFRLQTRKLGGHILVDGRL